MENMFSYIYYNLPNKDRNNIYAWRNLIYIYHEEQMYKNIVECAEQILKSLSHNDIYISNKIAFSYRQLGKSEGRFDE